MTVWVVCLREHGARPSGTKCLECDALHSREHRERLGRDAPRHDRVRFTMADESWRRLAACRGRDTDLWFRSGIPAEALGVCNSCPVKAECLGMAMRAEAGAVARYGVFGGLPPQQRAVLARAGGEGL